MKTSTVTDNRPPKRSSITSGLKKDAQADQYIMWGMPSKSSACSTSQIYIKRLVPRSSVSGRIPSALSPLSSCLLARSHAGAACLSFALAIREKALFRASKGTSVSSPGGSGREISRRSRPREASVVSARATVLRLIAGRGSTRQHGEQRLCLLCWQSARRCA